MRSESVSSAQNPKIRELIALQQKSSLRRESGLFVVEGRREVTRCMDAGFRLRTLFVCPEILGRGREGSGEIVAHLRNSQLKPEILGSGVEGLNELNDNSEGAPGQVRRCLPEAEEPGEPGENSDEWDTDTKLLLNIKDTDGIMAVEIPASLYDKVAYRGGTEGIIAVFEAKEMGLEDIRSGEKPLFVVLEGVEKPGNLGAVLRSADAAGATAVILCDCPTDLFNPNLIRASLGAIFSTPVVTASSDKAIAYFQGLGTKILTAQLQDSHLYYDADMIGGQGGVAIVMGTESVGLTDKWREAAAAHIRIPMLGRVDSLNVSVSAAILLYEALRQRHEAEARQKIIK